MRNIPNLKHDWLICCRLFEYTYFKQANFSADNLQSHLIRQMRQIICNSLSTVRTIQMICELLEIIKYAIYYYEYVFFLCYNYQSSLVREMEIPCSW